MRVRLVDPSVYTPPDDHSLARALARAGAGVELSTSRPTYDAPAADGFTLSEDFYRRAMGRDRAPAVTSTTRANTTRTRRLDCIAAERYSSYPRAAASLF